MMDAPEKIWLTGFVKDEYGAKLGRGTVSDLDHGDNPDYPKYVRADIAQAMVAAAYEDAAKRMKEKAEVEAEHSPFNAALYDVAERAIKKLAPTDARAALDAMMKAEREKALREAAEVCERIRTQQINGPMPERACFDYEQSILALIDKDKADG